MASTEALREISRFALSPNKLNLCGLDSAQGRLWKCVANGETQGIEDELSHGFPHLNAFLNTLAHISGGEPYSSEVVNSYWLGTDLLRQASIEDYDYLVDQYRRFGAEGDFLAALERVPKVFVPTHNFQVLHVGVLEASGELKHDLPLANQCMIRPGEVVSLDQENSTATINIISLVEKGGVLSFKHTLQKAKFDLALVPDLEPGQTVAVHWGWVVKPLFREEQEQLAYWTQAVVNSL